MQEDVKIEMRKDTLECILACDLDHHHAKGLREKIDHALFLEKPRIVILDFSAVSFMDSSGIGLIMGRYARMKAVGGELVVQRPNERIRRIFEMAGIERIVRIEEKGEEKHEA